ncbi:hypothetical protein [Herbidospora cretacea]|uniref:hypothetical protein n=1 Tax=Herbidospora cretacea TaxID=28444 RepID=UPI0004C315B9|nr:hypothetical protein [Herbidospora cretacea]
MTWWRRLVGDLKARNHLDTYALTVVVFTFAILSLVSDALDDDLRWAVLLSGVGLLIYRLTLVGATPAPAELLHDRTVFEEVPLPALLRDARDVRVFAPSAVNLLSPQTCELLRKTVLTRRNGSVRVVVLDPAETAAIAIAARQLDDSLEFPIQRLPQSLASTLERLKLIAGWGTEGAFAYRLFPYNPGFSLVLVDPEMPHGRVIVEFHGFHNPSTSSRMHLELVAGSNERWYRYWVRQFDRVWEEASVPEILTRREKP